MKITKGTPIGLLNFLYLVKAGLAGGQTAIGGTEVTDILNLQGTSGNGTSTSPAIKLLVGNNGATTALTVLNNGNVGIGTTTPTAKLDIEAGNINIDTTTFANQNGIILKDGTRFIHNFNYGNNLTVTTAGFNTFAGLNSGNFTMGATATQTWGGSYNTGFGQSTLSGITTGSQNTAVGAQSLLSNTIGDHNISVGMSSLFYNTTGTGNVAVGSSALVLNNGNYNAATGYASLYSNTTGYSNIATGYASLYGNTTGYYNIAIGYEAGRYIANGITANQIGNSSLYIGYNTKASADGNANETVIGYNNTGLGSNTVVLGNSSVVTTALQGNVGIGTTAPTELLDVNSDAIRIRTAQTPASATAAGTQGMICWDANYIYVCTATNTWKRTAIATW